MAALGILVSIVLPAILFAAVNLQLSQHLTSSAKAKAVRFDVFTGWATVQGLTITQPSGFGGDLFLDLPEIKVKVAVRSLLGSSWIIDEVMVTGATARLIRRKDGKVNVAGLFRTAEGKPGEAGASKPIHIKKIIVKNVTVRYTDLALSPEPVDVRIIQCDAVITDVFLDPVRIPESFLLGKMKVTAKILQPGFTDAPLGIIAQFGRLTFDQPIPTATVAVRLAGLELKPLQAVIPQGMSQIIGGDIVDVNVDAAMMAEELECRVAIVTPAGNSVRLKVGGTPRQPVVDNGSIWGALENRAGEAGMNALGNIAGKCEDLGNVVLALGVGMGSGVRKTNPIVVNRDQAQVWRADIQRRWSRSWEDACK